MDPNNYLSSLAALTPFIIAVAALLNAVAQLVRAWRSRG